MAEQEQLPADWLTFDHSHSQVWDRFTVAYRKGDDEWYIDPRNCLRAARQGQATAIKQWRAWREFAALEALKGST